MNLTVGLPGLGTAQEILPKNRKVRIKLKPKAAAGKNGSMGESEDWMTLEVFSNFNDFMSSFALPSLFQSQGVCQDFFFVGSAAPRKRFPSPTPSLHPEHHPGCTEP